MGEHRVIDWLGRRWHPFLIVFVTGVLIRLFILLLSTNSDTNSWAENICSLQAGFGLYDLEGYYYTPVWGYVLGLMGAIDQLFLGLGETSIVAIEVFPAVEASSMITAVVSSLEFLILVKAPLYISDFIMAYLVMRLVHEHTGDRGKAVLGFALTFLAPTLLLSSGVIAMPDTISAMFAVLTVYLLKHDHYLIGGMTFSLAFLTKFFPVFMIFVMVAYILAINRGDYRKQIFGVAQAAVGFALMTFVIFLPQILDGNIDACFQFITDRSGTAADSNLSNSITGPLMILIYVLVAIASAALGYFAYKNRETDPFETLMRGCLIVAALVLIYPPNTQYLVILVPFLAYWIATHSVKLLSAWEVLAVGSIIHMSSYNVMILLPIAVWTGFIEVDAVVDMFLVTSEPIVFGFAIKDLMTNLGGVIHFIVIVMVLWHFYGDRIVATVRRRRAPRGPSQTEFMK